MGIFFWGAFNWSLELTNTESFCISCHEMENNVYQEYKKTIHYSSATGVRASCPDCHVPREWTHKVMRKVRASNELFHWLIGSVDTREKFQAKRSTLAQHVWQGMRETDSRECRNCHKQGAMAKNKQSPMASNMHQLALEWKQTCIECHQGIAHTLPNEFDRNALIDRWHKKIEQKKIACYECHKDMPVINKEAW
jgi:cytochrome c-type protein NapC